MDLEHTKQMLDEMSKRCAALRDRLDTKGSHLTSDEKQTIRFAAFPSIGESLGEIKSAFLTGSPEWLERALEGVGNYMKSFMD